MTEKEFREIYHKYYRLVMKVANGHIHDMEYSRDICQEVFLKFSEKLEKLDMDYCTEWFSVNTTRKSIDFIRKAYNKYESPVQIESDGETVEDYTSRVYASQRLAQGTASDLSHHMVVKEFTGKLFEDLFRKNRDWYELAVRIYVEHQTDEEAAGELRITIENLRIRKHRMRKWIVENYMSEYDSLV